MKDLMKFEFHGKGVRTVTIEGEPWFVAKDVCEILELENVTRALETLDTDERNTLTISKGIPGNPNLNVVSESGLYALVFKSRKPEAKEFRKWVTKEVLPQIRKTGRYEVKVPSSLAKMPEVRDDFLSLKDIAEACGYVGNQALLAANKGVKHLHGLSPLALLEIELKSPDNEALIIATEIGKRLEPPKSAKFVNLALANFGLQEKVECKQGRFEWRLTEEGKEYGTYLDTGKKYSDGTPVQQIKWKESVIPKIEKLLDEDDD